MDYGARVVPQYRLKGTRVLMKTTLLQYGSTAVQGSSSSSAHAHVINPSCCAGAHQEYDPSESIDARVVRGCGRGLSWLSSHDADSEAAGLDIGSDGRVDSCAEAATAAAVSLSVRSDTVAQVCLVQENVAARYPAGCSCDVSSVLSVDILGFIECKRTHP